MEENKKILNATSSSFNDIKFKSKLEINLYKELIKLGYDVQYEPRTFLMWEGFKPITPIYDKETAHQRDKRDKLEGNIKSTSRQLVLKNNSIIGIKYTPDFYFRYKDYDVYIEAKGLENDVFYIKKKLFIKYLDDLYIKDGTKSLYFEVYSKKQLLQALTIIHNYEFSIKN